MNIVHRLHPLAVLIRVLILILFIPKPFISIQATYIHIVRQTDRQIDRKIDRETDRWVDKQNDRMEERYVYIDSIYVYTIYYTYIYNIQRLTER